MNKPLLLTLALAVSLASGGALRAATPAPTANLQPLALADAVKIALQRNNAYRSAAVGVEAARAQLGEAEAPLLPGIALQDSYQSVSTVAKLSTPIGALPFSAVNATNSPILAMQYTLFDGGIRNAHVGQAAAGLSAAESQLVQARGATIAAVSQAYFGVVTARRMDEVARRAVAVATQHEREAELYLKNGTIPRADLLRAQAELADQNVRAIGAAGAVKLAENQLDMVLGVPLTDRYRLTEPLGTSAPAFDLSNLLQSALSQRGDLAAARAAVRAARKGILAAKASRVPQINAVISDGNTQPAVVGGYHNQFAIGLTAVWTLFDNGYSRNGIALAEAGLKQAQFGVAQLKDGVELQVRQAYLREEIAASQVEAAKKLVAVSDETLRLAELRYRGGVGTELELEDADLGDRAAHETLARAEGDLRVAIVELRFSAGLL
uniref:TolC family protein n=1 Tax=mine drainage metagenome TaxID=410659 RepID=E6PHZ2_9ZZZZ